MCWIVWLCLLRGTYVECAATDLILLKFHKRTQGAMSLCAAQGAQWTSSMRVNDKTLV